jgi:adenylate cyclase
LSSDGDAARSGWLRSILFAPGRIAAFGLLLLLLALRVWDPLLVETARLRGFDLMQRMMPRGYAPAPVRLVVIDEASLAQHGRWPWPRALLARLVDRIAAAGASVLALDLLLVEPDGLSPQRIIETLPDPTDELAATLRRLPDGDAALAAAMRRVPTVLGLGTSVDADPAVHGPLRLSPVATAGGDAQQFLPRYPALLASRPELRAVERGRGALAAEIDRDGVQRRLPLFVVAEDKLVAGFAADIVRVADGGNHLLRVGRFGIEAASVGRREVPVDARGRAYLHFAPAYDVRYVSATALLQGTADPQALRGTVALLGLTGLGVVDVKQTPLGLMNGVEVHAQLVESLLADSLLRRAGYLDGAELLLVLIAGLVVIILPQRRAVVAIAGLAGVVLLLLGGELAAFRAGLLLDGAYPALAALACFGVMLSGNLRATEQARRRLAAELQREREAKARLEGELNTARAIQMGLLPRRFPGLPDRRDVETYALIEPARTVGGDLYDLLLLDERRLFFMIADVSGKGVPAALFMAMCKEVLRGAAYRHGEELDQAFAEANAKIAAASNDIMVEGASMMFVTVLAGVLDLETGLLVHASAGHDAPYVLKHGQPPQALTSAGGPPLGAVDDFPYSVESYQLAPGDLLMLYTDGVTEAEDRAHAFYTVQRLEAALAALPALSAKDAVETLRQDLRRFVAEAEPADDITMLAVRWISVP